MGVFMYKSTDKKELLNATKGTSAPRSALNSLTVIKRNQQAQIFSVDKIESLLSRACAGFESEVEPSLILHELEKIFTAVLAHKSLKRRWF